jgi:hypothetical protein
VRRIAHQLAILVSVFACSIFNPIEACTLIGCTSGLSVQLNPLPSGTFRVEVSVGGFGAPNQSLYTFDCNASPCPVNVFFPGLVINHGFVRVTTSAGAKVTEIHPIYESHRPNGADCPPDCRQATIAVSS